ncbi:MAG: hypothetical protein K1X95_02880 [Acidimicrobiia bacterium]|nr:hypothetical protein [Acidimicrobiia bacterium]
MDIWLASRRGVVTCFDVKSRAELCSVDVAHPIDALVRGGGSVWVAGDRALTAVDAASGVVASTEAVAGRASALVIAGGEPVVLSTGRRPALTWPESGRSLRVGAQSQALAAGYGALWVACQRRPAVVERRDPATGEVVAAVEVHRDPQAIWCAHGSVWVATDGPGGVDEIDPATDSVTATVEVPRQPTAVREAFGALWVAHGAEPRLTRVDPDSLEVVASIRVGAGSFGIGVAGGDLWLTQAIASRVCVVDPNRNGVRARFDWDEPFAIG